MELGRAREAEAERLLDRNVQEAELLQLLRPAERADVDRLQPAVRDELRDLLLQAVVGDDDDVELLAVDLAGKERWEKVAFNAFTTGVPCGRAGRPPRPTS